MTYYSEQQIHFITLSGNKIASIKFTDMRYRCMPNTIQAACIVAHEYLHDTDVDYGWSMHVLINIYYSFGYPKPHDDWHDDKNHGWKFLIGDKLLEQNFVLEEGADIVITCVSNPIECPYCEDTKIRCMECNYLRCPNRCRWAQTKCTCE